MNTREKLILVLVSGILIRLLVMPHTQHPATGVKVDLMDEMLLLGHNPMLRASGIGTALYLFFTPPYIIYNWFQQIGISYNFILYTLLKIPSLVGDLIIFYSLYEIIRITTNSKDKALNTATFYFLNPYVIFIGYWVGHVEQLTVSLVLLSILFLIKGQSGKSGVFYAMSIFTRYIPILLFPLYFIYLWLDRSTKDHSLGKFIMGLTLMGIPLFLPYIFIVYQTSQYAPSVFISYFTHFFEASTVASAYTLNMGEFMFNFTGFITSIGLWDLFSFLFGAKMFLVIYFTIFFVFFCSTWRRREITAKEVSIFPFVPYALFMILIPLQQHHYLAWVLPFLYLAVSFSIIPTYFVTILWIGNLLIDPITGQDYKFAFGNTFSNPFPENIRHFINLQLQLSISVLMGTILLTSLYFYIKFVKNQNFRIKYPLTKSIKLKSTFFVALLAIYSITEIVRMVYHPILYTFTYSILFSFFILLELFELKIRSGLTLLWLEKRILIRFLNLSSMFLILAVVSTYLWDPSYAPIFIVLSIVSLWDFKGIVGPEDAQTRSTVAGIFLFIATTYILLLAPNYLNLTLYAIFLATWIACQFSPGIIITRELEPPEKIYNFPNTTE